MDSALPSCALIVPACNEAAVLSLVAAELREVLPRFAWRASFVVATGVNDSTDGTADLARREGWIVGETSRRGYGHGCLAAIRALAEAGETPDAYVFMAADGANDPRDLPALLDAWAQGHRFVLGSRTCGLSNVHSAMSGTHWLANRLLGAWCGLLTGRWFCDLGPFRLIEREFFERLALSELTYGWTIEAQILAARLGERCPEVPVSERPRLAGEQKVSGVSLDRTLSIGAQIFSAGWRAARRPLSLPCVSEPRGLACSSAIRPSSSALP